MKSLDTNVVLRFLLNDVPAQTARVKSLLKRSPLYVSDVIICEAVFVLENMIGLDRPQISHLLKMLAAVPGLITSFFLPDVIDLYVKKAALSFVDCYAAVEAKTFGASLYTFDKKLINQCGAHVSAP